VSIDTSPGQASRLLRRVRPTPSTPSIQRITQYGYGEQHERSQPVVLQDVSGDGKRQQKPHERQQISDISHGATPS